MAMSGESQTAAQSVYDVIVVGGGAAGLTAAAVAGRAGSSVLVLEAAAGFGGSTAKSSGGFWVPRNRLMMQWSAADDRFVDDRDRCLAHMARLSYPHRYRRGADRHGLSQHEWDLIVDYYDNAADVLVDLESTGDIAYMLQTSFREDGLPAPAWHETEEDGNTHGRLLTATPLKPESIPEADRFTILTSTPKSDQAMAELGADFGNGVDLIRHLGLAARKYGVELVVSHRVTDLLTEGGAVVGVIAESPAGERRFGARQGVVFGSGGMEHSRELRERFLRGPIVGSCGAATNRGDFIPIAERVGAALGNTREAWWSQLPLEPCLESFEQSELMNQNYGDSTVVVSADGERVVNEKLTYNERGKIHSRRDAHGGFPYRLLIQIFDDAIVQDRTVWPARWPIPTADDIPPYILIGQTLQELTSAIRERLAQLADRTDGFALSPDFADNLTRTIQRFNRFARAGTDEDFNRGATSSERFFSVDIRAEPMPNSTMYPIAETGPYYAVILGASCLGTKGGPKINTRGQVLRGEGTPIPGLYGAGNCIASPTGEAYWGGGSTLGPAIFNGFRAGQHVALEPIRDPVARERPARSAAGDSAADVDPSAFAVHRCVVRDDVEIAYVREGIGGLPLVLIHGWPSTKRLFWRNIRPLAEAGFEVIVPDSRGFGDSPVLTDPARGATIVDVSYDVKALLERLGHTQAVLAGGDFGGGTVQDMALRFPGLAIRQVVWNGPSANLPEEYAAAGIPGSQYEEVSAVSSHLDDHGLRPDSFAASLPTPEARLAYIEGTYTVRPWQPNGPPRRLAANGSFDDRAAAFMAQHFTDADQFRASLRGYEAVMNPELSPVPALLDRRNTTTETMVLYGTTDEIVGANYARRAAVCFERLVGPFLIQDSGHFISWEQPAVFNSALTTFCRDLLPESALGSANA
jgi:3-oxosteroid 1-dehydrogenase